MKRNWMIITLIALFSVLLVGCQDKVEQLKVETKVVITEDVITVSVDLPSKPASLEDLNEIAMNIASQTYEAYFDQIGTSRMSMILNVNDSLEPSTARIALYGTLSFIINDSITSPGLKLNENKLVLE